MNEIVLCDTNSPGRKKIKEILEKMISLGSKKAQKKLDKLKEDKYTNEFWFVFSYNERHDKYLLEAVKKLKPSGLIIKKFKGNQYRIVENDVDSVDIYETLETPKDVKFITIKN